MKVAITGSPTIRRFANLLKLGARIRDLARQPLTLAVLLLAAGTLLWSARVLSIEPLWEGRLVDVVDKISDGQPIIRSDIEPYLAQAADDINDAECRPDRPRRAATLFLRLYELNLGDGLQAEAKQALEKARYGIWHSLRCDPLQPNLWLLSSQIVKYGDGPNERTMALLDVSYRLGRYEGWISARRFAHTVKFLPIISDEMRTTVTEEGLNLLRSPLWPSIVVAYFSSPAFAQEFIDELLENLTPIEKKRFVENRDYVRYGWFRPDLKQ